MSNQIRIDHLCQMPLKRMSSKEYSESVSKEQCHVQSGGSFLKCRATRNHWRKVYTVAPARWGPSDDRWLMGHWDGIVQVSVADPRADIREAVYLAQASHYSRLLVSLQGITQMIKMKLRCWTIHLSFRNDICSKEYPSYSIEIQIMKADVLGFHLKRCPYHAKWIVKMNCQLGHQHGCHLCKAPTWNLPLKCNLQMRSALQ